MEGWLTLWKIVLSASGVLFAVMVLVCGVRGAGDLRDLFQMLQEGHTPDGDTSERKSASP